MKESTRQLFALNGLRLDRTIHAYVYFSWIDRYIKTLMAIARRWVRVLPRGRFIFDYFFNRYHCKVLTDEQAVKLLRLEQDIEVAPELSSRVIPYPHANNIILKQPQSIVVMDCACRIERGIEDPEDLNVCFAVGEPVASFWLEHGQRLHARRISADEAIEIMRRERAKGSIPTAWFKDAAGDRFFSICNCGPDTCDALEASSLAARLLIDNPPDITLASGYCARVDRSLCTGCGTCVKSCPFRAVALDGEDKAVVIFESCMGCGLCVDRCKQDAMSLVLDERKGVPLDIDELS
ncbi:MAG: 4Fe-4S binding protein [Actinobacteria bacterium]|nr:4Fe-4S binding protein [Actinomycetota bacterium]